MELTADHIIGIIGLALSAATLLAMIFNFRVLNKSMEKIPNITLFGDEAVTMADSVQDRLPHAVQMSDTPYRGGGKRTPQFTIENGFFAKISRGEELKGAAKIARFYYKDAENQTMVRSWRVL